MASHAQKVDGIRNGYVWVSRLTLGGDPILADADRPDLDANQVMLDGASGHFNAVGQMQYIYADADLRNGNVPLAAGQHTTATILRWYDSAGNYDASGQIRALKYNFQVVGVTVASGAVLCGGYNPPHYGSGTARDMAVAVVAGDYAGTYVGLWAKDHIVNFPGDGAVNPDPALLDPDTTAQRCLGTGLSLTQVQVVLINHGVTAFDGGVLRVCLYGMEL